MFGRTWACLILCLLVVGCGPFDDDTAYAPQWQGTVLQYQTGTGTGTSLGLYSPGGWVAGWEAILGITGPIHATLWQGQLWVLSPGWVHQVEVASSRVLKRYPVGEGVAYLAASEERLGLLDTVNRLLLIAQPGEVGFASDNVALDFKPRLTAFQAGRWLVVGDGGQAVFADEQAAAIRTRLVLTFTNPERLSPSPTAFVLQGFAGSQRTEWFLSPVAEQLSGSNPATYTDRRYSPLLRRLYSTEYLGSVTLASSQVRVTPPGQTTVQVRSADSFVFDFQGSVLFYTDGGVLKSYAVNTPVGTNPDAELGALPGPLVAAWPVYNFPAFD
jgi:hypothetical protein